MSLRERGMKTPEEQDLMQTPQQQQHQQHQQQQQHDKKNALQFQGPRLARLQTLLKAEELENEAERKILAELNRHTFDTSNELCVLVWEVRALDRLIHSVERSSISAESVRQDKVADRIVGMETRARMQTVAGIPPALRKDFEDLVSLLRMEPSLLGDALQRGQYLHHSNQSPNVVLCQAIVFSLFGNCFMPTDEKQLLKLIEHLCKLHHQSQQKSPMKKSAESFPLTLLSTYLNYTFGRPYLNNVLKDVVISVLQDPVLNLEQNQEKKQALENESVRVRTMRNSDEPHVPLAVTNKLHNLTCKLLTTIINELESLPYGIRWISRVLIGLQPTAARDIIINIVFEQFFIPALIRPEQFGIVSGLTISHRSRNNLNQIARTLLEFAHYIPSQQQATSTSEKFAYLKETHLDQRLAEYFTNLTKIPDVEEYFCGFESEYFGDCKTHRLMASSTDLFMILEIVYQNQPEEHTNKPNNITSSKDTTSSSSSSSNNNNNNNNNDNTSVNRRMIELIDRVQTGYNLQEGMKFFILNVNATSIPTGATVNDANVNTNNTNSNDALEERKLQKVKETKANLLLLLRLIDYLCGYHNTPLLTILNRQFARNRSFQINILDAQTRETIRGLSELPTHYTANDFSLLLDELFSEYATRAQNRRKHRNSVIVFLDQIKRQVAELKAKKQSYDEYLTHVKCKEFREQQFEESIREFVEDFSTQFHPTGEEACCCIMSIHDDKAFTCSPCKAKSAKVSAFMDKVRDLIVTHKLWADSTEEDIELAVRNLERNIMTQLFSLTFKISQEDAPFSSLAGDRVDEFTIKDLTIHEKFQNQAPWALAQRELKKINLYKSPHDKLQAIIDCWNIVFNYIKPLGDVGPDDFLPIMAFVVLKAQPPDLISNINYISLFTHIGEEQEVSFMNFKSAIEILREMLLTKAKSMQEFVKPVSQRMEAIKAQSLRNRREMAEKRRSRVVELKLALKGTPAAASSPSSTSGENAPTAPVTPVTHSPAVPSTPVATLSPVHPSSSASTTTNTTTVTTAKTSPQPSINTNTNTFSNSNSNTTTPTPSLNDEIESALLSYVKPRSSDILRMYQIASRRGGQAGNDRTTSTSNATTPTTTPTTHASTYIGESNFPDEDSLGLSPPEL